MAEEYVITDNKTSQTLTITSDSPPTPQDVEEIFAVHGYPLQEDRVPPTRQPLQPPAPSTAGAIDYALEGVAGFNRPFAWLADRTLMTPINLALQVQGKQPLSLESMAGPRGYWAGEGVLSDAMAAAGELSSLALGFGTASRAVVSVLDDAARIGGTTFERVLLELGKTTPRQDLALGAISGVGGEGAAAVADALNLGPNGEQAARVVGQVVAPGAWQVVTASLLNTGKRLLKTSIDDAIIGSAPDTQALKGAGRALYTKLDEAGIVADASSSSTFTGGIKSFVSAENVTPGLYPTTNRITKEILSQTKKGALSFGYLLDVSSLLRRTAANETAEAPKMLRLAKDIDDFMDTGMIPTDPSKLGSLTIEETRKNAREFWRRGSASDTLDTIFNNAIITSESTGANFSNEVKKGVTGLLKNSNLMRATLQAGNDAGAITRGYFSATPASLRKPQDLAILLLVNKANISSLANSPARSQSGFIKDVIFFTQLGQAAMDKESQEQPQQ